MKNSKRLLQIVVLICGLVPVTAGLAGAGFGSDIWSNFNEPASFDSHFRYLSGLLLGIGICFWMLVRNIEHNGDQVRMLCMIVMVGGLARLNMVICHGLPNKGVLFALTMELVVTPLLMFWQMKVAKAYGIKEVRE